jgi:GT2 family glycosyltransferase
MMPGLRFSLIVATLGRTEELVALLQSLQAQTDQRFEVIIVDQNEDARLVPIIAAFRDEFALIHVRTGERGLSRARNRGLRESTGEIVAFPDDDCTYPAGLLAAVDRHFLADPALVCLSGPAVSPTGALGSGRWNAAGGMISMRTVWTSVIAFNLFVRADAFARIGGFDEQLGVGARFGSAEETDLVIRAMRSCGKALYDPALQVVHPDKRLTREAADRAFRYGTGLGHVLRKHRAPARTTLTFLLRPAAGAVLSALRLKPLAGRYYWKTLTGRLAGYLSG